MGVETEAEIGIETEVLHEGTPDATTTIGHLAETETYSKIDVVVVDEEATEATVTEGLELSRADEIERRVLVLHQRRESPRQT